MSNLLIENMQTFKIEDKEIFYKYYEKYPQDLCDYNFANLFLWGNYFGARWTEYKNRILIYNPNIDMILMPVGEYFSLNEMLEISDEFRKQNRSGNFILIPKDFLEKNPEYSKYFSEELDENNANYVYTSEKLAELKGRNLHKKRNLIYQFQRNYPNYEVIKQNECNEINYENCRKCIELVDKWVENKDFTDNNYLAELEVMKKAGQYFKELELEILIIKVNDEVIAFSIFNKQNDRMATVHFEKFNINYKGAAQIINNETAKYLREKYYYINREEDLGIPELRKAKMSYFPDLMLYTYKLRRK